MNILGKSTAFFLLLFTSTAHCLTIHVTNPIDTFDGNCDSNCSLREAVQLANETPGHDYIYLDQRFLTTYSLKRKPPRVNGKLVDDDTNEVGDLDILDDVTILGAPHAQRTFISPGLGSRAFDNISGSSRLINLTIMEGSGTADGGGIRNQSTLEMRNTHLQYNFSYTRGGAIANFGTLTISSAIISNNSTSSLSTGQGAEGGGIYNEGILTIRDSEIRNNEAYGKTNTNMGGGLFNRGQVDIRRSFFFHNSLDGPGNGLAIFNADGGSLKLVSSTISGNIEPYSVMGFAAVVANGDPLYNPPEEMFLTNVTIAYNQALGFFNAGTTYIKNSIILNNIPRSSSYTSNCSDYSGNLNTYGLLLGVDQTSNCYSDFSIADDTSTSPHLTALLQVRPTSLKYEGPIYGHVLPAGSAAIDAGGFDCPGYDQIASPAPLDGNEDGVAECDLGALEFDPELTQ